MIDAFFSALGVLFVLVLISQIFSGDDEMRKKRDAEDARQQFPKARSRWDRE